MSRFVGTTGMGRSLASAAACLALTALVGCGPGGGGGSGKATISGKVTYQGAPVTGGTLTLYDDKGSPYPVGIKADGTFNVSDVPIGQMGVGIDTGSAAPPASSAGGGQAAPHVDIPPQYKNPQSSGLTWDIKAGKNTKNFDLK